LLVGGGMDHEPVPSLACSTVRCSSDGACLHTVDLVAALLDPEGPPGLSSRRARAAESLLQRLTRETEQPKIELDASLPILAPPVTERRYLRYCAALWGFYAPLERKLRSVPGLERAIADLGQRWKTELLEQDLAELGVNIPELALPTCQQLPRVSELPRALGACYALGLCTLGHRHIQRYLSHVLPSMTSRASRYLSSYGSELEVQWAALGEQIQAALGNAPRAAQDAAVSGAIETLLAARAWSRRSFVASDEGCGAWLGAAAGGRNRAAARASWGAELERALLRTWPQLGLSLPPWSELERALLLWVPWARTELRQE
jgi:heme oxygenase